MHVAERSFALERVSGGSLDAQEVSIGAEADFSELGQIAECAPIAKSRVSLMAVSARRARPRIGLVPRDIAFELSARQEHHFVTDAEQITPALD